MSYLLQNELMSMKTEETSLRKELEQLRKDLDEEKTKQSNELARFDALTQTLEKEKEEQLETQKVEVGSHDFILPQA